MRGGKDLVLVLFLACLNSLPGGEGLGGEDGLQVLCPNDVMTEVYSIRIEEKAAAPDPAGDEPAEVSQLLACPLVKLLQIVPPEPVTHQTLPKLFSYPTVKFITE